jgi:hypothetical protein
LSDEQGEPIARKHIHLPVLKSTSPSLSELMRTCFLKAALSRANGLADFVVGNPKAWLGTAYHEVLAAISSRANTKTADELWNEAIDEQQQEALKHPLDSRFGPPASWPGYHVMLATVRLRAQEIAALQPERNSEMPAAPAGRNSFRETRFVAMNGKLVGKPDVVLKRKIIDYKTGSVTDTDDSGAAEVRASYARQLRLYAYITSEVLGLWPESAELVPMHGDAIRVEIDKSQCQAEAAEAVALLEKYNEQAQSLAPEDLARPSPEACKWCGFKLLCNRFWQSAEPTWSGTLDGEAIAGVVAEPRQLIHSGLAARVVVDATAGTVRGRTALMPLKPDETVSSAPAGTAIRAVSLKKRPDGTLSPTLRSNFVLAADLPQLTSPIQA